jgi:hypothetical protein
MNSGIGGSMRRCGICWEQGKTIPKLRKVDDLISQNGGNLSQLCSGGPGRER